MLRQAPLAATQRGRRLFVPHAGFDELLAYASHGYNVLALGERGGGKTSSLRQLQLTLGEQGAPEAPVTAFADLSMMFQLDEVLAAIIDAGRSANGLGLGSLEWSTGTAHGSRIDGLLGYLGRLPTTRFLLDNIDPEVGYRLFGGLRDRLWELNHSFVVAVDQADRSAFTRPPADAFWEQIVELQLTEEQALELLLRRGTGPDWAREIVGAVGARPRRLIAAAQKFEAGQQEPAALSAEYARRRQRIDRLSAMAGRLFQELEDVGPTSPSDERLLRRVAASRPAVDRALRELQAAGLARSYFQADGPGRPRRIYEVEQ